MLNQKELGARIKQARLQKGLTQAQLADKLFICRSYVGNLEHGMYYPSYYTLSRLAEAMDISLAWFDDQRKVG